MTGKPFSYSDHIFARYKRFLFFYYPLQPLTGKLSLKISNLPPGRFSIKAIV